MRTVSLNDPKYEVDPRAPERFHARSFGLGDVVGAKDTGATLYELPPGQAICPYHFEYVEEEWVLILEGRATVRTPEGTEELGPMEVGFFPKGEDGAHQVRNESEERVLLLMWSNRVNPGAVAYPDSDKVTFWASEGEWFTMVRPAEKIDYWTGEG